MTQDPGNPAAAAGPPAARRGLEPALVIGPAGIACGIAATLMLAEPSRSLLLCIALILLSIAVLALSYGLTARLFGWRRMNFETLFHWIFFMPP